MEQKLGQRARVIWLTGLPCSGKTTLGMGLHTALLERGYAVRLLDGDITRKGLCRDLGFSPADREENIRRVAELSKLFADSGFITINAFITPTEALRQLAGEIIGAEDMVNVYVNAPLEVCENRDVKGMYRKARQGIISEFTGVTAPFEVPLHPDIEIDTTNTDPEKNTAELLQFILPLIRIQA
ncbi:MAG TPA: adenylyl-sulfate kinase [Lentimicrobium sp.]|jgi:adenylylsulfate kinase|nr:adenylyl-sulfate kinase [Lentimicrobium sp.]